MDTSKSIDTGKLLSVIKDILLEEAEAGIQTQVENIVSYYSASDPESLNAAKEKISKGLMSSKLSHYSVSDYGALEKLNVAELFGPGLYQRLENSLNAQAHEVATLLQNLATERKSALASLEEVRASLGKFDFEPRVLEDGRYEIGFVLPASYADLAKTEQAIKDFALLLNSLADAVEAKQPLRIKYVSNGSIELFIDAGIELAQNFDVIIEFALKVYGTIEACIKTKKFFENYSKKRRQQAEKIADEEKKEKSEALIEEMIGQLNIQGEQERSDVRGRFKKFLEHIEAGVGAEVRTPDVEEPKEPNAEASDTDRRIYEQKLENFKRKQEIDSRNQEIFVLQQNNFYGMNTKFLNYTNNPEVDAEDQTTVKKANKK